MVLNLPRLHSYLFNDISLHAVMFNPRILVTAWNFLILSDFSILTFDFCVHLWSEFFVFGPKIWGHWTVRFWSVDLWFYHQKWLMIIVSFGLFLCSFEMIITSSIQNGPIDFRQIGIVSCTLHISVLIISLVRSLFVIEHW